MEYANTNWNKSAYKALVAELKSLAEPGYKAFHERLCTTSKAEILGVRSPYVKKIAKSISKGDVPGFLSVCENTFYEEILLKAFVIAFWRRSLSEKWKTVEAFVPEIDNWAVCDGFCAALKVKASEQAFLLTQCENYSRKAGEYDRRFALVMLMDHLLTEPYLDTGAVLRFYGGGLVRFGFVCPRQRKNACLFKDKRLRRPNPPAGDSENCRVQPRDRRGQSICAHSAPRVKPKKDKEKTPAKKRALNHSAFQLDCAGNLTGAQAACASVHSFRRAVHDRLNSFNIGFPGSVGASV